MLRTYGILSDESLKCECCAVSYSVSSEEFLSSFDLVPIYPFWGGMKLVPEFSEGVVFLVVLFEDGVKIRFWGLRSSFYGLSLCFGNDDLNFFEGCRAKLVIVCSQCVDFFSG